MLLNRAADAAPEAYERRRAERDRALTEEKRADLRPWRTAAPRTRLSDTPVDDGTDAFVQRQESARARATAIASHAATGRPHAE
jgi:hypothetical protein